MAHHTEIGLWEITDVGRQALKTGMPPNTPMKNVEPNASDADPKALPYVFLVVQQMKKGLSLIGAAKQIQKKENLKSFKPLMDACTGKINLTAPEFEEFLKDPLRLVSHLSSLFPEHEQEIRDKIST